MMVDRTHFSSHSRAERASRTSRTIWNSMRTSRRNGPEHPDGKKNDGKFYFNAKESREKHLQNRRWLLRDLHYQKNELHVYHNNKQHLLPKRNFEEFILMLQKFACKHVEVKETSAKNVRIRMIDIDNVDTFVLSPVTKLHRERERGKQI